MTNQPLLFSRARVAAPRLLMLLTIVTLLAASCAACSSGSTKNPGSAKASGKRSGGLTPESQNPTICPTDAGLTNCGLGPTNPPPKAIGNYTVRTFAGSGSKTFADGSATDASFVQPTGIAAGTGGAILVADAGANRIRSIGPDGTTKTLAGSVAGFADGPVAKAKFRSPRAIAVSSDGTIYVADTGNNLIRAITRGVVSTYAGTAGKKGASNGAAAAATFASPIGLAIDAKNNLYVTEFEGNDIRVITSDKTVKTFAGGRLQGFKDGPAAAAAFHSPVGIQVNDKGDVFVCDTANNRVRKISGGTVTTVAGSRAGFKDGKGTKALLNAPYGMTLDKDGNVFVTEFVNRSVRKIDPSGAVTTIVTSDGSEQDTGGDVSPSPSAKSSGTPSASLSLPSGIAWLAGSFYVSDTGHSLIRLVSSKG
ncbi:MAG: hypothetical protein NVSMB57_11100 [Actinomycetota bacterium]